MTMIPSSDATRTDAEIRARIERLTLEGKIRLLSGKDHWSTYPDVTIGLRPIVLSDGTVGIRGVRWSEEDTSINTPSATAVAATFDPAVAAAAGAVMGGEARRKGVDVVLGPVINLQRSPFGGRHFEAFSEDPLLTAQMGAAMVTGMQAEGVATAAKHFVGNESETDRLNSNSVIEERVLREAYLLPFEAVVAAGGLGVMASYNRLNGTPVVHSAILTELLKEEWGFDGFVVSDWGAIRSVVASASAGTDLAMPGPHTRWADGLAAAVRAGEVAESAIDEKVLRVLRLAARVGALDGIAPLVDRAALPTPPRAEDAAVQRSLRDVAALGTVLLRNEGGVLPLDPVTTRSLAVIGPAARTPRTNGGGSAAVVAPFPISPLDALAGSLPDVDIRYAEGARPSSLLRALTAANGRAPSGDGVVSVEFLDADGAVIGAETRDRPDTLVYGMGYPDGVPEDEVSVIRLRTRITVPEDGDYLLSAAGVGHARVTVDGAVRVDDDLVPINDDAVLGMSLPPQAIVELTLRSDRPVDVEYTYRPAPRTVAALRLGFDTAVPDAARLIADAVDVARAADTAVVFVGTSAENEAEGFDRTDLALPGAQDELVRAVAAVNPRTVVVVNAGAPVLLPWRDEVAAIVLPWFGGQAMGPAVADVLTGAAEPGGRLPVTFPADERGIPSPFPEGGDVVYREGLDIGYRGYARSGAVPAYPFGHGLGYTTWDLGEARATSTNGGIAVTVTVRNTGHRHGRIVVQAYVAHPAAGAEYAVPRFAGATACELDGGAQAEVSVTVADTVSRRWDAATGRWEPITAPPQVFVGTSSRDLRVVTT
ncbi:glycoside hydrolase family 3 C-terminal domain-containing protein [Curtobacterium pusillum]|uniref:Glycosyl hydrolase n=1 Tax=Curtobacterium pusillum TaxID=69373 RepID=A0ABX2M8W5_9MICO|nr:glycoside hydrolase family 3 C-terminal domain-containing protein [Curtobacterium pusillum]NUU14079.1 glycosyl hydrolase [Curtobacterium pusillum]GLK32295.1 glycosyl hydrolase [Curtobacterium pusillum]